jgi:hypothetical protein
MSVGAALPKATGFYIILNHWAVHFNNFCNVNNNIQNLLLRMEWVSIMEYSLKFVICQVHSWWYYVVDFKRYSLLTLLCKGIRFGWKRWQTILGS